MHKERQEDDVAEKDTLNVQVPTTTVEKMRKAQKVMRMCETWGKMAEL